MVCWVSEEAMVRDLRPCRGGSRGHGGRNQLFEEGNASGFDAKMAFRLMRIEVGERWGARAALFHLFRTFEIENSNADSMRVHRGARAVSGSVRGSTGKRFVHSASDSASAF